MMLGGSETPGTQSHLFTALDLKCKNSRRAVTLQTPESFDFPTAFSRAKTEKHRKRNSSGSVHEYSDSGRSALIAEFFTCRCSCKRKGRYNIYQRTYRKISGTSGWQSKYEYFCNAARRFAQRISYCLPQSVTEKRNCGFTQYQSGYKWKCPNIKCQYSMD